MDRVAVYCASQAIYKDTVPAIKSMLMNGRPDRIYLLIEDDEFPEYLPPQVKIINVRNQPYFDLKGPNIQTHFTYMALMRAVLTKVLPDEDKVLSMDCDTLVVGNIDELWEKDLGDYYFSATREPLKCRWDKMYYNTGVTMFNLKAMREDGIDDELIEVINSNKLNCPEQDALCIVCAGNIMDMPSDFNCNQYTPRTSDMRIRHHCGYRANQWSGFPDVNQFRRTSWDEVMKQYENR